MNKYSTDFHAQIHGSRKKPTNAKSWCTRVSYGPYTTLPTANPIFLKEGPLIQLRTRHSYPITSPFGTISPLS
jgi:hypothetical protein